MKNFGLSLFIIIYLATIAAAATPQRLIRIDIPYHEIVYSLHDRFNLTILNATDKYVDALAADDLIKKITKAGFTVTVLAEDYSKLYPDLPQVIHTYAEVCSTMIALSQQYPTITKLETLGFSYSNRVILAIKVTDNPSLEEAEPEIRLVGAHHGNEKISTEVTLSFLKYLLENYDFNAQVADLVNNREIWIIPIFNPDGHVANSRYNGAGADLNRDYGYMWQSGTSAPWSQPETRHMQRHSNENNITLEYEYHSTDSYVNYLWDHHPKDPPDSQYIALISQEYADSTYGSPTTQLQKINGFDWYVARGSAQDACFGIWGGIGTTIETQYPTTQAKVDSICVANRRALMKMITRAGWGISGQVRDSLTQSPLLAMIQFTNPKRWPCYTDKTVGDFHKMVAPGNYTLTVSANGYQPKTFSVTVPDTGAVNIIAELIPDTTLNYYIQKIVWVRRDNSTGNYVNLTYTMDALGASDLTYYSLGVNGTIVFEADPPIRNYPGADFTIIEGDLTPENYTVALSNDWRATWFSYPTTSGTASFDLATVNMDSARYLRIIDASGSPSTDPYAGFDLDAIVYRQSISSILEPDIRYHNLTITDMLIYPNPARSHINIKYHIPNTEKHNPIIKIYDITGKKINEFKNIENTNLGNWILDISKLTAGVYFIGIEWQQKTIRQKIVKKQ
ncbi:MAG: M14 family zinc carboxypeptidase [candidate division WOR-3 bacterium]